MNDVWLYTILSVIAVSTVSLVGLFTIWLTNPLGKRIFLFLVGFSAGALLGDVFIHLLPELVEEDEFTSTTSLYILGTIIGFFILEKYLHWHHHHGEGDMNEHATHPFVYTNLIGDGLHNLIDGMIIAGAYMLDINLGIATTIAVALHEIPQEIGDFGVLVYGGFTKSKALLFNFFSALTAVVGAVIALYLGENVTALPILIALGIGSFTYISLADLIPAIHKEKEQTLAQLLSFGLGIVAMFLLLFLE